MNYLWNTVFVAQSISFEALCHLIVLLEEITMARSDRNSLGQVKFFLLCDCIASCRSPCLVCVKLRGINFWSDSTLLLIAFSGKNAHKGSYESDLILVVTLCSVCSLTLQSKARIICLSSSRILCNLF